MDGIPVLSIPSRHKLSFSAFTLAELLIALAILGMIATFAIPKVLTAQQNAKNKSIAKEGAAMVAAAFQTHKLAVGGDVYSYSIGDLTPYMNYVKVDTSTRIDHYQGQTYRDCAPAVAAQCLLLHSGAILRYNSSTGFCAGDTRRLWFWIDPDGVYSNTTDGPGKSVEFFIFANGRLATRGNHSEAQDCGVAPADPTVDPPWFSWD